MRKRSASCIRRSTSLSAGGRGSSSVMWRHRAARRIDSGNPCKCCCLAYSPCALDATRSAEPCHPCPAWACAAALLSVYAAGAWPRSVQRLCCGFTKHAASQLPRTGSNTALAPTAPPAAPCAALLSVQQPPCAAASLCSSVPVQPTCLCSSLPVQQCPCAAHLPVQQPPCAARLPVQPSCLCSSVPVGPTSLCSSLPVQQCLCAAHLPVQQCPCATVSLCSPLACAAASLSSTPPCAAHLPVQQCPCATVSLCSPLACAAASLSSTPPCAAHLPVQQCPCGAHFPVQQPPCAAVSLCSPPACAAASLCGPPSLCSGLPVQPTSLWGPPLCAAVSLCLPVQQPTSVEGDLLGVAEAHERLQCAFLPGGDLEVQLAAVAIAPLLQFPPAGGGPSHCAAAIRMEARGHLHWNVCWLWNRLYRQSRRCAALGHTQQHGQLAEVPLPCAHLATLACWKIMAAGT